MVSVAGDVKCKQMDSWADCLCGASVSVMAGRQRRDAV